MQQMGKMPSEMQELDAEIRSNPEWVNGFITLDFENYKLNQGIPDWKFEEDEEYY